MVNVDVMGFGSSRRDKVEVLPFNAKSTSREYYQVVVGEYGVSITADINPTKPNGVTLLSGKASCISLPLAKEIATRMGMGAKVLKVTENWSREVEVILGEDDKPTHFGLDGLVND